MSEFSSPGPIRHPLLPFTCTTADRGCPLHAWTVFLLQQANEAPPQVSSGAEPDLDDEVEEGGSPERDRTRNINTGEPQHHEAHLRRRIGTAPKGFPQHMRNRAP